MNPRRDVFVALSHSNVLAPFDFADRSRFGADGCEGFFPSLRTLSIPTLFQILPLCERRMRKYTSALQPPPFDVCGRGNYVRGEDRSEEGKRGAVAGSRGYIVVPRTIGCLEGESRRSRGRADVIVPTFSKGGAGGVRYRTNFRDVANDSRNPRLSTIKNLPQVFIQVQRTRRTFLEKNDTFLREYVLFLTYSLYHAVKNKITVQLSEILFFRIIFTCLLIYSTYIGRI